VSTFHIRPQGLHAGLPLHAVRVRLAQSHAGIRALIGTTVDGLEPFIYGLVMSRPIGRHGPGRNSFAGQVDLAAEAKRMREQHHWAHVQPCPIIIAPHAD
jgi:hypothetical protein